MGVVALEWVVAMVTVQKRLNHWFSATVSNAQQRQEQSFGTVRRATPERKGSRLARKFTCSWFHSLPLWWLFVCSFIRKSCVYTCWKKWRPFYIYICFFGHSPTMVNEKYFRFKWTHFRKIHKGRLSFFLSWRHFLDTSRLTKIIEGHWLIPIIDSQNLHKASNLMCQEKSHATTKASKERRCKKNSYTVHQESPNYFVRGPPKLLDNILRAGHRT